MFEFACPYLALPPPPPPPLPQLLSDFKIIIIVIITMVVSVVTVVLYVAHWNVMQISGQIAWIGNCLSVFLPCLPPSRSPSPPSPLSLSVFVWLWLIGGQWRSQGVPTARSQCSIQPDTEQRALRLPSPSVDTAACLHCPRCCRDLSLFHSLFASLLSPSLGLGQRELYKGGGGVGGGGGGGGC